jgi:hypothetical protein
MGPLVLPLIGAGVGAIQSLIGNRQQKKADQMMPEIPPIYQAHLSDLRRKQRNADTGSLYSTMMNRAKNTLAYGNKAIMSTGNPMAYNFAQKRAADLLNGIAGAQQQARMGYEQSIGDVTDSIGNMRFQIDTNRWANKQAQAQSNKRTGMQNLMAGLINNIPILGGNKDVTPPVDPSAAGGPPALDTWLASNPMPRTDLQLNMNPNIGSKIPIGANNVFDPKTGTYITEEGYRAKYGIK